jgi:hypothetical protein
MFVAFADIEEPNAPALLKGPGNRAFRLGRTRCSLGLARIGLPPARRRLELVEREGRREVAVGLDLLPKVGDLLLGEADRVSAGEEAARRLFLVGDRATSFYADWERVANDVVATLRAEAGRDPYDRDLSDLVGELSMRSETFRTLWAAHNVRSHDTGVKRFRHSVVGELTMSYEAMELVADPGLTMFVYTAEPGSKSEEALNLLGSWTATLDQEEDYADHEEQHRDRRRFD